MQDRAPSASARSTSWPDRMPLSNMISMSEPTASATAGSAEIAAQSNRGRRREQPVGLRVQPA